MSSVFYDCIDCGSEFCPCDLAETGDCLVCSRLSGKDYCDCDWKGVCVYNEFMQGGGKAVRRRKEFNAKIVGKKKYEENITVLVLDVGRGFTIRCSRPGSYVFLRSPADENIYDIPVSVLRADIEKGYIHLAIAVTGPKSRKAAETEDVISVRGVYSNGILGVKNLTGVSGNVPSDEKILILTKGTGFAPAALFLSWLDGRAEADIYADIHKTEERFITDYIPGKYEDRLKFTSLSTVNEDIWESGCYDRVAVFASDYFTEEISRLIKIDARSNNHNICCGEGICGACTCTDSDGRCFRMCKCALKAEFLCSKL